ncbi:unnamed protein product [Calicophoron daubneyi]|uniref:Lethal giant larvae homologue 2 domain-containing protein n=1 Tax=Calicophoron daubneyi TaxID=300641 RepID=A0AAV2TRD3_CALDB
MAQRIFQSFRRLPGHLTSFRKKPEIVEIQGTSYKINVCSDYGFPAKPACMAYDPILDLLAVLTRDGSLFVYGRPGVSFSANHSCLGEYIQVEFFNGTRIMLTLTGSDDIYLWELSHYGQSSVRLTQIFRLQSVTTYLRSPTVNGGDSSGETAGELSHVTSFCCASDGRSVLIGTDHGWVASLRLNTPGKAAPKNFEYLCMPTPENAITPTRILNNLAPSRHQRLSFDAVVVLSERPGFPGQLLIGYTSGLSLIYDLRSDRVIALLPWKHGLEAASWCGGTGLLSRSANDIASSAVGTRLLTAHSDGSLGVWNLKDVGTSSATSSPGEPPSLTMEEPPSMPYGPFPCKLISKVYWLPSALGGITAFVGGMPRATYGERHTVSLLRGSNLDRAAAANMAAARLAAAADTEEEDDDLMDSGPIATPPMHVFDPDAPEHVCFDLPSPLVDLLPIAPGGGPAQILLILCEEELVAVDLITQGWPFIRPPYLTCLHTSTITTYSLFTQVNSQFLSQLESAGAYYGPEGRFGRGSAVSNNPNAAGWSQRPWPIQGGQALVNGSRLSTSLLDESLQFSDDLLLTGHEDGSVVFWRMSAGGCLRRIYTLHSAILFDGEFGLQDNTNGADDETDAWPPFRQAGVFDPFMDDSRAAVNVIRLVDSTVAVGGAAGQLTVWRFLDFAPPLSPVSPAIKTEIPGFQWKGYAPLKLRPGIDSGAVLPTQQGTRAPPQLQAVGVVLVQPPARITALILTEVRHKFTEGSVSPVSAVSPGVLLALGTPHGYSSVYLPPVEPPPSIFTSGTNDPPLNVKWQSAEPQVLLTETTLPDNISALQEAAAGEGWARRRTRELKKSLRDSFRRLKRMRSTKSSAPSTTDPPHAASLSRAGVRRTITQSNRGFIRQVNSGPYEEAEQRASGSVDAQSPDGTAALPPVSIEREICDRPADSASVAIVTCFTFAPPLFRTSSASSPQSTNVGSLFVGTKAGIVKAYAIFANHNPTGASQQPAFRLQLTKQLILQHRAPILALRVVDSKQYWPLSATCFDASSLGPSSARQQNFPTLLVTSEEQVRLFSLPSLRLRFKARITAKDGYRIKAGAVAAFRISAKSHGKTDKITDDSACADMDRSGVSTASTPLHPGSGDSQPTEYSFVFTNVGGQAIVLSLPHLSRRDTLCLLDSNDVVAVSSVVFAETGTSLPTSSSSVIGPSLGLYQLAPGQITLFDVVRAGQRASTLGCSYRALNRLPDQPRSTVTTEGRIALTNGSAMDSSRVSNRSGFSHDPRLPPIGPHNVTGYSASCCGDSQINSSILSNTLSDSVRDCFTPQSGSSIVSGQTNTRRQMTSNAT